LQVINNIFSEKRKDNKIFSPLLNGKIFLTCSSPKIRKSMGHLTHEQRYKIDVLKKENYSLTEIGAIIGKDKSVVCRELNRNSDRRSGVYKADLAIRKCKQRHLEKPKKIRFVKSIKDFVIYWLKEDYSPEQIVGKAQLDKIPCVSTERIYQHIWDDKKQGGNLYTHLRTQGKRYRKRGSSKDKRGQIVGRIGIENRPKEVDLKERLGDFEIDLVIGKDHKRALITANDRVTGMVRISIIDSKDSEIVKSGVIKMLYEFKPILKTITSDNGKDPRALLELAKQFSQHQTIAKELDIGYYFARPYHSWERGANENLNGLIRQYFPKGSSFENITNEQVKIVENKLNERPRKRFGFLTPNQVYLQKLTN
jgi:IS30 family transposase